MHQQSLSVLVVMHSDHLQARTIELTHELPPPAAISFNSERLCLEGLYCDELSAYRARRSWKSTLVSLFLLEEEEDFAFVVQRNEEDLYSLECQFLTACARYAFWRLTNHQAPEAQYMIETAHLPVTERSFPDLSGAPDLCEDRAGAGPDATIAPYGGPSTLTKVRRFLARLF